MFLACVGRGWHENTLKRNPRTEGLRRATQKTGWLDRHVIHVQVLFHIYEDAELKPLLDAVNDEREKEKENES